MPISHQSSRTLDKGGMYEEHGHLILDWLFQTESPTMFKKKTNSTRQKLPRDWRID
eukprot:CAMPEP_0182589728 /NCGR_PEP_ID=MMETSP1324-20130603/70169_1 /TAXON_ID=236786 /ORGANISM="Florenciella sp., Strain RCC1587" /LENGTH=55 /DNA_ID=CAMNT_0024806889 /DNA_START=30 /DNA_END=194 /DNA_ORIENTATION=+